MDKQILKQPKDWIWSKPLENYSSLHEVSPMGMLGINIPWKWAHVLMQISFNLHTPLTIYPQAYLTFHTRDSNQPSSGIPNYSITNIKRWRMDVSLFKTGDDYFNKIKRWHRCNYIKSEKIFKEYGCTTSLVEGDWSEHADTIYSLYANVANRYGDWLYNRTFFQEIAKRPDYKLLCAWYDGKIIGAFVLQEEQTTLHSTCCCLDYFHSSNSYAYTWMHYALINECIAKQKYANIDVGITADEAKKAIGFVPIQSNMDIYSRGLATQCFLRLVSRYISATITSESKLKFSWIYH